MCANRVIFKQLLQANAIEFCQIDSARVGGVNENLAIYLMAKKLNGNLFFNRKPLSCNLLPSISCTVKVCPHAGGVGLCEMVQHLQMWDYTSLSATKDGRYIEYVDQQHEQFINPSVVKQAHYVCPTVSRILFHWHDNPVKLIGIFKLI